MVYGRKLRRSKATSQKESTGVFFSLEQLAEFGVLYWKLNPKDYENDEELRKIRETRGYSYMLSGLRQIILGDISLGHSALLPDLLDLCPEKVDNYEQKFKNFDREHIHADEEIRYCLEGSGYFEVRDKDDRWMKAGDMIVLPAGIYHRFTFDTVNYVKPVWTPYNRPQEDHPARREYIKSVAERVGVPLAAH
ncbi:hypothetical protein RND71_024533 [Anisodus tanguticus]|uniref:Acireductone dioxygenase (Fe(2+)-requiring) n=1 Tax=Anisodus tanguticus TaxID=243964 RepID=A0AAE1RRA9_9SOLA|nr:hypothetical protein RND71_024533 [Anisodus tanguticus]